MRHDHHNDICVIIITHGSTPGGGIVVCEITVLQLVPGTAAMVGTSLLLKYEWTLAPHTPPRLIQLFNIVPMQCYSQRGSGA